LCPDHEFGRGCDLEYKCDPNPDHECDCDHDRDHECDRDPDHIRACDNCNPTKRIDRFTLILLPKFVFKRLNFL